MNSYTAINTSFHKIKFLIYGVTYAIWGYISYALITVKEPYYERVVLGILFFSYGLVCDKVVKQYGYKLNQYITQLIDISVAIHYYTLMLRTYDWGEQYFVAYVFGFLVVMFATGFSTRDIPELISWCFINFLVSILISFKITFIHPVLFILFVSTIILYVCVIGVNSARLLKNLMNDTMKRKSILSNMLEGVVVQSQNGDILEYNQAALNILDFQDSSLNSNNFPESNHKFIWKDTNKSCGVKDIFAFSQMRMSSGNLLSKVRGDDVKWIKVSWANFELNKNVIYITTLEDVTDSVLSNIQLQTQKEIANHKSKLASLGELAAGVGHEINNPLAIISGQCQILKKLILRGSDPKTCVTRIEKVLAAVERVTTITKGLRTFSRADKLEISYFDFKEPLEESINLFKEVSSSDGVEIFSDIADKLYVKANRGRLIQVIINLLNNAKDALLDSKNKIIQINAYIKDEKVFLHIKDYGIGIDNEFKNLIFQPFFTTKDVDKGTGIGLSLASSIIKEHDGEILVESELGMWTEFTIELPLIDKLEVDAWCQSLKNTKIKANSISKEFEQKFTGHAIIVDDEEDVREIVAEMLGEFNVNCFHASNGEQALSLIEDKKNAIELVVSDIKMPIMNGIDLLRVLRESDYDGKFYFISGGVNVDLSEYNDQIDGFFQKPFDGLEIQRMLM